MRVLNCKNSLICFRKCLLKYLHTEKPVTEKQKILKQLIVQKIKATGPMTVAQFMKEVLINPACGYYTTKDMFGKTGDFITSPEINQIFGELVAVWFANEWMKVGAPKPFHFVELGPGRGSMMSDILRTFHQLKMDNNLQVHMMEISDTLANIQAQKLCMSFEDHGSDSIYYRSGITNNGVQIRWYKNILDARVRGFTLYLAHEFFDALPIHKFQRTKDGWREVLIDLNISSESDDKLRYVLSPGPTPMSKMFISESENREEIEVCPEGMAVMEMLADRMERYGGIMLIFDYGHCGTKTDTFRAFRKHEQCHPLDYIGDADLTADVDFSALKKVAGNKLVCFGPITQRQFLKQMNIDMRLKMLLKNATNEQKDLLESGCRMLTDEDQMGHSFYVVSFFPEVLKSILEQNPPVGFIKNEI